MKEILRLDDIVFSGYLLGKVEDEKDYYAPANGIVQAHHKRWHFEYPDEDEGDHLTFDLADWFLKGRSYPLTNISRDATSLVPIQ